MATVLQANKESSELGGHIASYQSAATLYEVGFNHFWHAPSDDHGGDLVFIQGHSAPGFYARAFLEGRLSEDQLRRFRQEVDAAASTAAGISSYPHPWLMPDFWQFPTVSMGLGPIMAIYQARFMKYLQGRGIADTDGPQGVGVPRRRRDGRAGVARRDLAGGPRAARQPDLRRQLQPAAPRRPGARQRQDHPGARDGLPRRGLERHQGRSGARAGTRCSPPTTRACSSSAWRRPSTASTRPSRRATAPTCASTSSAPTRAARDGRGHDRRRDLGAQPRRPRPQQGLRRLRGRRAHGPADGDPRQDDQGLRDGRGRRGPEHHPPAEEDDDEALLAFRDRFGLDLTDEQVATRVLQARRGQPEMAYLRERREALGGGLPARGAKVDGRWRCRTLSAFGASSRATGDREISTTMAFVRILNTLLRDKQIGRHVVPIVPDESRTFGMEGHVPPARDLQPGRPALPARGRRPADVLQGGQAGPDPPGGHQRGRRVLRRGSPRRRRTPTTACR